MDLEKAASWFGCKSASLPFIYLGLPLGTPLSPFLFGILWKRGLRNDLLYGRANV